MDLQYKPTKQKKEKPVKAPKMPKADKPMSFGSAKTVKIDRSKKVKEPKIKAPKREKAVSFAPTKVDKAQKFEKASKFKKPLNTKALVISLSALVVILCVGLIVFLNITGFGEGKPTIKPEKLMIIELPNKVEYSVGELAAFADMKLQVTLSNGVSITLKASDCEIVGFDSSAPADSQTITVKYKSLTTTFNVRITKAQGGTNPTGKVTGLTFKTLPKTEYKVDEFLSVAGGVLLLNFENGSYKEIELSYDHVFNFNTKTVGTHTVDIQVEERGEVYKTTYTITVTE